MVKLLIPVETRDRIRDPDLLVRSQFRENRQCERFPAELLGHGTIPGPVPEKRETLLPMQGERVVHPASDSLGFEERLKRVAVLHPRRILMVNVIVPVEFHGRMHQIQKVAFGEKQSVTIRDNPSFFVPFFEMSQPDAQDRRLQGIQTAVEADLIVEIRRPRAMHAKFSQAIRKPVVVRGQHSAVPVAAEILRREKRVAADRAERSGPDDVAPYFPPGAEGLRGVLDDRHTAPFEFIGDLLHRRHLAEQLQRGEALTSPGLTRDFLQAQLRDRGREVFALLLLDNQHRVIRFVELFYGTLDSASVWPREIVQIALKHNAAAVILAHNHPSGVAEPSRADRQITDRILAALALVDIRVLDHLVIGDGITVSFAERGWL